MKISFSTLACPNYEWGDIMVMAKDLGFDSIEIRGLGRELFTQRSLTFTDSLAHTKEKLDGLGLSVSCVSSGCCLKYGEKQDENIQELKEYIDVADSLGSPFVRVLADDVIMPSGEVDDDVVRSALMELVPYAHEHNVVLLIETNGAYSDTKRLRDLLDSIPSDSVAALWDMHHPYRYAAEQPSKTVENLGAYIKYVHIKDSVMIDGVASYRMMGDGDLPVEDMMLALTSINYEGAVALEWVKKWAPDLQDAGVVFPHFVHYMSKYTHRSYSSGPLIPNLRGDGYYVWEKEHLIDLTLPQVLDRMVEEFPERLAFDFSTLDYTRTYSEFRDDVDRFARALVALGVKRGDHVAIWATNVPQWYITFWATVKIGAVLVTVNTAYKIYEAEYLLRQSDTHTLVMTAGYKDSDYVDIMRNLCPELASLQKGQPLYSKKLPFLRNIITCGCELEGCLTWEEAQQYATATSEEEITRRAASITKHDVCNMQYTSGTTGFPKGVMLTHYNVVNNGKAIGDCMDLSTADTMMIQVPMFHCFGMVLAMTAAMTHGVTMSPLPYFRPADALRCINLKKVTCFHGVPTMFIALLEHPDFASTDFSHMRTGIMAGSPCPVKVMQQVIDEMHMSEIVITYGQTEASPGCTMSKTTDTIEQRVNTVGQAMFGVECRIVDPETYEELPDGVDGEFVARGYNIMKGYYKMPAATALAIDKDGWLHTGDLARRTPDGYYKITGRIKDMIIRGGENIYPKELEDFIYTHPKVSDVQVIGVPDKQYGEEIMACVIVKEGETLTEDELREYIRSHIAKHKCPKYIEFTDSFPMNAAGKILKYKMREAAVEKLGLVAESKIVTA